MEKETKKIVLTTIVCIVVVFVAIVVAFFLIDYLLKGYILEEDAKYEFFRDILIINLSIIAVIFGTIVFWIQLYIVEKVENHVVNRVKEPLEHQDFEYLDYIQGTTLLDNGYILWLNYKATQKIDLLNAAIEQTKIAYTNIKKLDDENPRYVLAKCQTKNNLGYYLAARGKPEDKEYAIKCAEFINTKLDDFLEYQASWMHTYKYIMSKNWEITDADSQDPKVQDQGH